MRVTPSRLGAGMALRPDFESGQAFSATLSEVRIFLSTTAAPVDGLSLNLPDNVGQDNTLVRADPIPLSSHFTGPAAGPKDFDIQIAFKTPFFYQPTAGNLLLWVITETNVTFSAFDAVFTENDGISRAWNPALTTTGARHGRTGHPV
jgi:hypothetical protein